MDARRGVRDLDKRGDAPREEGNGNRSPAELFDTCLLRLVFMCVQRLTSRQIAMRVSAATCSVLSPAFQVSMRSSPSLSELPERVGHSTARSTKCTHRTNEQSIIFFEAIVLKDRRKLKLTVHMLAGLRSCLWKCLSHVLSLGTNHPITCANINLTVYRCGIFQLSKRSLNMQA